MSSTDGGSTARSGGKLAKPKSSGSKDAPSNNNRKSLLASYFWGVLTAFGLLSMYLAVSSPEHHLPIHHHHQNTLQKSKISLSEWRKHHQQQHYTESETETTQTKKTPRESRKDATKDATKVAKSEAKPAAKPATKAKASASFSSSWTSEHPLAGLSCKDHGGPSDELAQEMVYWEDIPADNEHMSPFYEPNRFLTFEPDHGGWNNIRMAMETVVALAYAMGRTLVLPPAARMYLLDKQHNGKKAEFSFADFFDMPTIHAEHNGFDIITTEEFMKRQLQQPTLKRLPPKNRTNWDGSAPAWYGHLRQNSRNLIWDPNHCIAYFPKEAHHDVESVQQKYKAMVKARQPKFEDFIGKPQHIVNTSEIDRLAEFHADRERLCLYSPELQNEPVLHFPAEHHANAKTDGDEKEEKKWDPRLLVQFYQFLFFADVHQDLWMKRFVRDHVRYRDEIQCAAARVVAAMREKVRTIHNRPSGEFHTLHCRRGDFQYKVTRASAEEILEMTQRQFKEGDIVFIATDQKDKTFFDPLRKVYKIYFLEDFVKDGTVSKDINTNFYGMIDMLVASRGKLFFGCWFSTFTGFINRLRGYHTQRTKEPGYEEGLIKTSWYYSLPDRYDHMQIYYPVKKSFYAREFPAGWRLLNYDLEKTATAQR